MAPVDEFCPVIVEMCGLRTDYHNGTKNYKQHCFKAKQATNPFLFTHHTSYYCENASRLRAFVPVTGAEPVGMGLPREA